MRIIDRERIIKKYDAVYVAYDDTEFVDKEECKKYEESAKCLLLSKYNKLVVKKDFEYNIFGCGSEDGYIDIVKVYCGEDIDVIMQTLGVINPHMLTEGQKEKYDKCKDILVRALDGDDLVFIFRGYDNDSFWVEGTLQDRIAGIAKACGFDIEYKLKVGI